SFHIDQDSLRQTYAAMHAAYTRIFTRLGFEFRAVQADSGNIGGNSSHEFHVLAASGEDTIAFNEAGTYAANLEMASALAPIDPRPAPTQSLQKVATPDCGTIDEVAQLLQCSPASVIKTLIVHGASTGEGQVTLVA